MPGEGYFVHDPYGDTEPGTSEGLWIVDSETPFPGELWALRGTVEELASDGDDSLTALTTISGRQRCATHQTLPAVNMPLPSSGREAYESMRVRLPADLLINQPPNRYQPNRLSVAAERIFAPTEMVRPGPAAAILDERFANATLDISLPPATTIAYRAGDRLEPIAGVYDLRARPQLLASAAPAVSNAAAVPQPPAATSPLRLASINLHNYFNGDGDGGGFPTDRGAESSSEFQAQSAAVAAAVAAIDPAILAVQELENDGYAETSAIADLTAALNQAAGTSAWTYIKPAQRQRLGEDAIAVGLLYREDRVTALGQPLIYDRPEFAEKHRVVMAQVFRRYDSQLLTLVGSVHLKSKGSCPETGDNADQHDGQACWNAARVDAVQQLSEWIKTESSGIPALLMGDFNSYRMEDPIRAMTRAGFVELVGQSAEPPFYSFLYRGGRGTLDYAFATPDLVPSLTLARHWHINADESDPPRGEGAIWRRFSDHDPVMVDLAR
ncbi:MAG: ExeM/NucH family extracellular endonuclease [Wenzhouxiangellaceae bacterium]